MSFGAYLQGVIGLAVVVGSLAAAAVRLRARLLPGWERAPARLVEAVLAVSILTVVLEALGAAGIFSGVSLVLACAGVAVAILVAVGRPAAPVAPAPPSPPVPVLHLALGLVAAAFLATHWATGLQDVWSRGILTFDSVWYHGPFSARIAETGTAWPLHFTDPLYLNWFYPENSELQHAAGIALFDHDLLSPLINFGWLGVALLAAWCIGRPYGVAPLSLVAVAVVLDTGPMVPREAGSMANDIAPIALLLAAAAILINATAGPLRGGTTSRAAGSGPEGEGGNRPAAAAPSAAVLLLAGLAAGLALGTKMTIAGAVAALAVGVLFLVPPGRRAGAVGIFVGGVAITAGFWFLRNLVHSGNPLPWINHIGPIDLPGPDRGLEGRDPYSVSHYLFADPNSGVWNSYFFAGVKNLLGPGWFLILGGSLLGAALAIARPRSATVRVLGAVSVVAAIAYVFTPLTAAGPEGNPVAFTINFRYLLAALALALALLALIVPAGPVRVRLPGLPAGLPADRLQPPLLLGGLATLVVTSQLSDSAYIWDEPFANLPAAALIGLVVIGAPVGLALLRRRSALLAVALGAVLALALVAVGWSRQDDYLAARYSRSDGFRFQLDDAVRWVDRHTSGNRIAVAGTSGAYSQYGFYGRRLDNYVQFVGEPTAGGDFQAITKCAPWRRAVNRGRYDYVITTPGLDLNAPETARPTPERGWLLGDPKAEEILRVGRVSVFRLTGPLDPAGCAARGHRQGSGQGGSGATGYAPLGGGGSP